MAIRFADFVLYWLGFVFAGSLRGDGFAGAGGGAFFVVGREARGWVERWSIPLAGGGTILKAKCKQPMNYKRPAGQGTASASVSQSDRIRRVPMRLQKRKPTFHQKQIRFLTCLFGALGIFIAIAILWFLNRGIAPTF